MSLPRVKIYFQNGNLGQQAANADGVMGLIGTGVAVASTFALNKAYTLYGLTDLEALGVDATNNAALYRLVKEFYDNAGEGTEMWLMALPDTTLVSDIVDKNKANAVALLNAANGRIRGLAVQRVPAVGYTPVITDGLDADVALAISNAQALGEWAETTKFAPIFVILEGYAYSGTAADLTDLSTLQNNRVQVLIGDTVADSKNTTIGTYAGRIASIGVQTNPAKVKDGPIKSLTAFVNDKAVEQADIESLYNKGYVVLRTYSGRAGYFFADDPMATMPTDDYSHLTYRRTIDKAYRIAYNTLLDLLLDNIPVNEDGTVQIGYARSWEADVEAAIAAQMTANGELSADLSKNDQGVSCKVDTTVNVLSQGVVKVLLQVRPFGYARMVDVYLGFATVAQ